MAAGIKMKESGTSFRERNNAGRSKNTFQKDCLTVGAPFNFVSRAKQILKEAEEKRVNLNSSLTYDSHSHKTAELYSMVDALVEDEDALEVVRIKKLVRDSIEATESEIQEYVKKQLSNENKPQEISSKKQLSSEKSSIAKNASSTPVSYSSLRYNQKKQTETSSGKTSKSRVPVAARNKRTSSELSIISEEPSKASGHESSFVNTSLKPVKLAREESYLKHIYGRRVLEKLKLKSSLGSSVNIDKNVSCRVCGYIEDTQSKCDTAVKQRLNLKENTAYVASTTSYPEQEGKYFPCAVPLAPPNRQKVSERVIESVETINLPSRDSQPKLMQQNNVALVEVVADQPIERQLTSQVLPSVDIIGKPVLPNTIRSNAKVITVDTVDRPDLDMGSEYPGYHFHLSLPTVSHPELQREIITADRHCKVSRLVGTLSSDSRVNPAMIAQIVQAVHSSYDQPGPSSKHETEINRELVENLLVELVHENLQEMRQSNNDNIKSEPVKEDIGIKKEMVIEKVDKETQSNVEPIVIPVELVSEYVQVSPPPPSVIDSESSEKLDFSEHPTASKSLPSDVESQGSATKVDMHPKSLSATSEHSSPQSPKPEDNSSEPPSLKGEAKTTLSPASENDIADQEVELPISAPSVAEEAAPLSTPASHSVSAPSTPGSAAIQDQHELDLLPEKDTSPVIERKDVAVSPVIESKDVAVQLSPITTSATNTTLSTITNISDSEFMEDLLSEGECLLTRSQKLLSLAVAGPSTSNINSEGEVDEERGKEKSNDYSLSEGEVHPRYINPNYLALKKLPEGHLEEANTGHFSKYGSGKFVHENVSSSSLSTSQELTTPDFSEGQVALTVPITAASYEGFSDEPLSSADEDRVFSEGEVGHASDHNLAPEDKGNIFHMLDALSGCQSHQSSSLGFIYSQNICPKEQYPLADAQNNSANFTHNDSPISESSPAPLINPISSQESAISQLVVNPIPSQVKESFLVMDQSNLPPSLHFQNGVLQNSLNTGVAYHRNFIYNPEENLYVQQNTREDALYIQPVSSHSEYTPQQVSCHHEANFPSSRSHTHDASKEDELHYYHRLLATQNIDQGHNQNLYPSLDEEPVKDISSSPSEEQVPADCC